MDLFEDVKSQKFESLSDRMKAYEAVERRTLREKIPTIMRLDGRSFKNYTSKFEKPFDDLIIGAMQHAAIKLCEDVGNVKIAYVQSDEITLVLIESTVQAQPWFGGNIQKMTSVAASIVTYHFNDYMEKKHWSNRPDLTKKIANFDARIFQLPVDEIKNNLIWRQQDAVRNSIQSLARYNFNHESLKKKNQIEMLKMLSDKGIEWNALETHKQRGTCIVKEYYFIDTLGNTIITDKGAQDPTLVRRSRWKADFEIPIFTEDDIYIEQVILGPFSND